MSIWSDRVRACSGSSRCVIRPGGKAHGLSGDWVCVEVRTSSHDSTPGGGCKVGGTMAAATAAAAHKRPLIVQHPHDDRGGGCLVAEEPNGGMLPLLNPFVRCETLKAVTRESLLAGPCS